MTTVLARGYLLAFCIGAAGVGSIIYMRPVPVSVAPQAVTAPPMVQPPERRVRTVDWFKLHRAELREVTAACRNDPGDGALEPECLNAEQAKEWTDIQDVLNTMPGHR